MIDYNNNSLFSRDSSPCLIDTLARFVCSAIMRTPDEDTVSRESGSKHIVLDQLYAYRSLDKVSGTIQHPNIQADRIKVHLVGTTHVSQQRFVEHQYRNVEKTWEFLRLTQRLVLASDASHTTVFSFRLPEALLETQCPLRNEFHILLPPTVGCPRDDGLSDLSPKDAANSRIEYQIVAEFLKDNNVVHTMSRPFRVAPRHFATPGSMNPPPGYDESLVIEADVHRSLGGKLGSIKTVLQQPPALLTSLEEHQLTTAVPLTIEYCSTSQGPPKIHSISIKIIAYTHTRTDHLVEGGEDMCHSVELRLNKLDFRKHTYPVWRPIRPAVWATDLELPVTLCPKGYVAVPEFSSCLMDRRYELTLKFDMSPQSGLPLSETRMKIPVWIMADEYYGIPSEARPGVPIKHQRRFQMPDDLSNDPQGSLPTYQDNYLTNLAVSTHAPAVVVGDAAMVPAPFSLQGREPGYFDRARRTRRTDPSGNGTIDGVEPEQDEEESDEANRVPSWQVKEEEQRVAGATRHGDSDAAQ